MKRLVITLVFLSGTLFSFPVDRFIDINNSLLVETDQNKIDSILSFNNVNIMNNKIPKKLSKVYQNIELYDLDILPKSDLITDTLKYKNLFENLSDNLYNSIIVFMYTYVDSDSLNFLSVEYFYVDSTLFLYDINEIENSEVYYLQEKGEPTENSLNTFWERFKNKKKCGDIIEKTLSFLTLDYNSNGGILRMQTNFDSQEVDKYNLMTDSWKEKISNSFVGDINLIPTKSKCSQVHVNVLESRDFIKTLEFSIIDGEFTLTGVFDHFYYKKLSNNKVVYDYFYE
jgi:hypothetical protein